MHGNRDVLLAGWEGDPPRFDGCSCRTVPLGGLRRAVRRARHGTVLLLGEAALRLLNPDSLRTLLATPRVLAFGVYRRAPPEEAIPWSRSRVVEVIPERRVLVRIRQHSRILRRPEVPPEEWVPRRPEAGSLGERLVRVLPRLRRPAAGELAAAVEVERHALLRECREAFGMTVEDLCWRYVDAFVRRERRRGSGVCAIAGHLGYADPRSLWRRYRARGLRVPGRSGRGG